MSAGIGRGLTGWNGQPQVNQTKEVTTMKLYRVIASRGSNAWCEGEYTDKAEACKRAHAVAQADGLARIASPHTDRYDAIDDVTVYHESPEDDDSEHVLSLYVEYDVTTQHAFIRGQGGK